MTVSVRDVTSDLSELVEEVIKGGSVTITRDGKPVATLVPVESEEKPAPRPERNLVDFLKSFPEPDMAFERNPSPSRDVEL